MDSFDELTRYNELLGRPIRVDDWKSLEESTLIKAKKAIAAGRLDDAQKLLDLVQIEQKGLHDLYCDWTYALLDLIQKQLGDDAVALAHKISGAVWFVPMIKLFQKMPVIDQVRLIHEYMRAHRSGPDQSGCVPVQEEEDRYVMYFDACGSGGRMRRGDPVAGTPPRRMPPFNFGVIKEAHDYTWGFKDVGYYCVECCAMHEQLPIELGTYPLWWAGYNPDHFAPCIRYIYKDPEKVPAEFFTRIGKKKFPFKTLEHIEQERGRPFTLDEVRAAYMKPMDRLRQAKA